jgi:hypothetical protein
MEGFTFESVRQQMRVARANYLRDLKVLLLVVKEQSVQGCLALGATILQHCVIFADLI